MKCEKCGEREATVHLTKIINNKKEELHLCSECAEKTGNVSFSSDPFSFKHLLSGMMKPEIPDSAAPTREKEVCQNCGLTYKEFVEGGLFGCARCYEDFRDQLKLIVKKVQGGSEHRGKIPRRAGKKMKAEKKIKELRKEMQDAVAVEDFERAAELRDRIKELENRMDDDRDDRMEDENEGQQQDPR